MLKQQQIPVVTKITQISSQVPESQHGYIKLTTHGRDFPLPTKVEVS